MRGGARALPAEETAGMERVDFLVVGCGPAGAAAAREAARAGVETVVLEKDAVVGAKRVCAAGLRPEFCETFDLPRAIVHYDTPRMALFDPAGAEHEIFFGPGHTTTREELDGTMGRLAAHAGRKFARRRFFAACRRVLANAMRSSSTPTCAPANGDGSPRATCFSLQGRRSRWTSRRTSRPKEPPGCRSIDGAMA